MESHGPYTHARAARFPRFASVACLGLLTACFAVTHDYRGTHEITPGTVLSRPSRQAGAVDGTTKATFLLFGLIPLNDASGAQLADDLARERYAAFDGITGLQIQEEAGALDVIVSALTLGIFAMQTVQVSGYVHTFAGAPP